MKCKATCTLQDSCTLNTRFTRPPGSVVSQLPLLFLARLFYLNWYGNIDVQGTATKRTKMKLSRIQRSLDMLYWFFAPSCIQIYFLRFRYSSLEDDSGLRTFWARVPGASREISTLSQWELSSIAKLGPRPTIALNFEQNNVAILIGRYPMKFGSIYIPWKDEVTHKRK